MHNAPRWSYFSQEMHSNCHNVSVAMTTEFIERAEAGLGLAGLLRQKYHDSHREAKQCYVECAPAAICMLMITCSYLNITRTRVCVCVCVCAGEREHTTRLNAASLDRLHHRCQNVDVIRWSQAISRHCYQTAGDTEYFDHIKMWTLMRKADVKNYKLSRSHSTDQCVPESKSKILS